MKIVIDRDRCMGSGNCSFHAEHTFDLDDAMKVVLLDQHGDRDDDIAAAVDGCPTQALRLETEYLMAHPTVEPTSPDAEPDAAIVASRRCARRVREMAACALLDGRDHAEPVAAMVTTRRSVRQVRGMAGRASFAGWAH